MFMSEMKDLNKLKKAEAKNQPKVSVLDKLSLQLGGDKVMDLKNLLAEKEVKLKKKGDLPEIEDEESYGLGSSDVDRSSSSPGQSKAPTPPMNLRRGKLSLITKEE